MRTRLKKKNKKQLWIQTELSELDQMNLKELNYCNLYKSNPWQIILILTETIPNNM